MSLKYNPLIKVGMDIVSKLPKTKKVIQTIGDLLALHPPNASNEIELGNFIYEIDSFNLDLGIYTLVTNTDTAINGCSQAINKLTSSTDGISLITSTGNLFLFQIELGCTGIGSQVISMTGSTGFESLDMKYVAFSTGSKYGTLTGIRQAFWSDGFSFNAREGFTLDGVWSGGFAILNSRIINTGNFLLKGEAGLRLQNVRSNVNLTIPSGSVGFDFKYDNFVNDQSFQIENCRFDGDGVLATSFIGGDVSEVEKSRKSLFKGNAGNLAKNSMIGGVWTCTTEVTTAITINTLTKLAGVTTYSNLEHLTAVNNNEFIQIDTNEISYSLDGDLVIDGNPNNEVRLTIRKYEASTSSYSTIATFIKAISNFQGGNDIGIFRPFVPILTMNDSDRIELWVTNLSGNGNLTMKSESFIFLKKL